MAITERAAEQNIPNKTQEQEVKADSQKTPNTVQLPLSLANRVLNQLDEELSDTKWWQQGRRQALLGLARQLGRSTPAPESEDEKDNYGRINSLQQGDWQTNVEAGTARRKWRQQKAGLLALRQKALWVAQKHAGASQPPEEVYRQISREVDEKYDKRQAPGRQRKLTQALAATTAAAAEITTSIVAPAPSQAQEPTSFELMPQALENIEKSSQTTANKLALELSTEQMKVLAEILPKALAENLAQPQPEEGERQRQGEIELFPVLSITLPQELTDKLIASAEGNENQVQVLREFVQQEDIANLNYLYLTKVIDLLTLEGHSRSEIISTINSSRLIYGVTADNQTTAIFELPDSYLVVYPFAEEGVPAGARFRKDEIAEIGIGLVEYAGLNRLAITRYDSEGNAYALQDFTAGGFGWVPVDKIQNAKLGFAIELDIEDKKEPELEYVLEKTIFYKLTNQDQDITNTPDSILRTLPDEIRYLPEKDNRFFFDQDKDTICQIDGGTQLCWRNGLLNKSKPPEMSQQEWNEIVDRYWTKEVDRGKIGDINYSIEVGVTLSQYRTVPGTPLISDIDLQLNQRQLDILIPWLEANSQYLPKNIRFVEMDYWGKGPGDRENIERLRKYIWYKTGHPLAGLAWDMEEVGDTLEIYSYYGSGGYSSTGVTPKEYYATSIGSELLHMLYYYVEKQKNPQLTFKDVVDDIGEEDGFGPTLVWPILYPGYAEKDYRPEPFITIKP